MVINISVYEVLFSWLVLYSLFIFYFFYLSLLVCDGVCLFVCIQSIETAEPIGPKVLFGNCLNPGKVYG